MKLNILIAESIMQVYEGDNWTDISIDEIVKNITFDKAIQQTSGSPNTIASLTHHLLYWNEVVMKRLNGEAPEVPVSNGFDIPKLQNEDEWKQLIESTHQSFL